MHSTSMLRRGYGSTRMLAAAALLWIFAASGYPVENIVLVPLDSRPAAIQLPKMIATIGDADLLTPPESYLGKFLNPGSPEAILNWLEAQDLSRVGAIIVSTDMIAYGGLIASRTDATTKERALARLWRMAQLRKAWPHLKIYGFSAVMRLAPTATQDTAPWRLLLARYEELADVYRTKPSANLKKRLQSLSARIPGGEMIRYRAARSRNHIVQRQLVAMASKGIFDSLVIGQDDASILGPQIAETRDIKKLAMRLGVTRRVLFCQGIDQNASLLISRLLLAGRGWSPRIKVVLSDPKAAGLAAPYESKPLSESLREQIEASGAILAGPAEDSDFTIYVNVPAPRRNTLSRFLQLLADDIKNGVPVAVADVNVARDGTCDSSVFNMLWQDGRMMKLLAFAGWNSAGNTIGTTIPAANIYLMARRSNMDPLKREIAQREFLLHRFVDDYAYHKYTRPVAYDILDTRYRAPREEVYGGVYGELRDFVRRDLSKHLEKYFREQVLGKQFYAGNRSYVFSRLDDVSISLPWPRAYEVSLRFKLRAQEVIAQHGQN